MPRARSKANLRSAVASAHLLVAGRHWGRLTLACFSEALLILKANSEELALAFTPLVLVAMNAVYMVAAYPLGNLADRVSARTMMIWALIVLIAADVALAILPGISGAFVGIALWGAHMAVTRGLFAKLVADRSPPELRGSGYGVFNLITSFSLLAASVVAGIVWDASGSAATFLVGSGCAGLALAGLLVAPSAKR